MWAMPAAALTVELCSPQAVCVAAAAVPFLNIAEGKKQREVGTAIFCPRMDLRGPAQYVDVLTDVHTPQRPRRAMSTRMRYRRMCVNKFPIKLVAVPNIVHAKLVLKSCARFAEGILYPIAPQGCACLKQTYLPPCGGISQSTFANSLALFSTNKPCLSFENRKHRFSPITQK